MLKGASVVGPSVMKVEAFLMSNTNHFNDPVKRSSEFFRRLESDVHHKATAHTNIYQSSGYSIYASTYHCGCRMGNNGQKNRLYRINGLPCEKAGQCRLIYLARLLVSHDFLLVAIKLDDFIGIK